MKALSLRQPWAWLVAAGHKDVENRTWSTRFRGEFLIHAAKTFDDAGYEWVSREMELVLPAPDEFERGGIVDQYVRVEEVGEALETTEKVVALLRFGDGFAHRLDSFSLAVAR